MGRRIQLCGKYGCNIPGHVAWENDPLPSGAITYLKVPYADKDKAKALGARWDKNAKKWYAPNADVTVACRRWLNKTAPKAVVRRVLSSIVKSAAPAPVSSPRDDIPLPESEYNDFRTKTVRPAPTPEKLPEVVLPQQSYDISFLLETMTEVVTVKELRAR